MLKMDNIKEQPPKDLFDVVGNYGPWQRNVFIVFFCLNCIGMWHNFAITFLAPNLQYKCVASSHISWSAHVMTNFTEEYLFCNELMMLNSSINVTNDQCSFRVAENLEDDSRNSSDCHVVPCARWEYNLTVYSRTIVDEWDLVCDNEWLVSLAKSIYMVGFMISVLVFGQTSDCIGRWPTILICYVITCVSGFMSAFSTSYLMFLVLRFFQAFGRTGLTTTGFVLITEIIGPKHRTKTGISIQAGWAVGFITLPAVAWFVRDWVWFQLITTIPIIPFFIMYWVVPESPRWLMTQGKIEKFEKVVSKAAKMNGKLGKSDVLNVKELLPTLKSGAEGKRSTLIDLFKAPRLRYRTFNCIYQWMVNAFMYYGLSYNTNDLAGNPYLNFFIAGALEMPSYLVVFCAISRYGRRIVYMICMLCGGIACAAIIAVPENVPYLSTVFAMIGKFCITGTFGILYLYSSELFPTVVRNVAIGSCSTCARVGSIVAPFVRELGKATHSSVPNAIYACLAISSSLLALLLPETNNKKIADTLEEGERFGSKEDDSDEVENTSKTVKNGALRCANIFNLKFFRRVYIKSR